MKLRFAILLSVLSSAASLMAVPYNGQGTYTIGSGGDYPTLGAFSTDYNAITSGMTGNTTASIISNLTEPLNVSLGAPTNGFTLAIKPAPSVQPIVTFTSTTLHAAGNSGLAGCLVIGPKKLVTVPSTDATLAANYAAMKVVIDGSNAVNGTSRDLTFQNVAAVPEINRFVINVNGDCDGTTIKNCKVNSVTVGATDNVGIVFWHRYTTDVSPVNLVPDNCSIVNCEINAAVTQAPSASVLGGVVLGIGIKCGRVGTASTGVSVTGFQVLDCDITAAIRCIYLNANAGYLVQGNRLKIQQSNGGGGSVIEVVKHDSSNGVLNWTGDIKRNTVTVDSQSTRGVHGAFSFNGMTAPSPGTVNNIINNFVTLNCLAPAVNASNAILHVVELEGNGLTGTFNLYHNSFNVEDWAALTSAAADADNYAAISAKATAANQFAGTLNVNNNIVRVAEDRVKYFQASNTTSVTTVIAFDNNTVYRPNQPAVGTGIHFAEHPFNTALNDFVAWQGAVQDTNSNQADPIVGSGGGKWVSGTNLHFDADPGATFQTAANLGIAIDIDNEARPNGSIEKGADEFYGSAAVGDWAIYN